MNKKLIALILGFGFAAGLAGASDPSCSASCTSALYSCLSVNNGNYSMCTPSYSSCQRACQGG